MSTSKKSSAKPTLEQLRDRVHKTFHLLDQWSTSPDTDKDMSDYLEDAIYLLYPEHDPTETKDTRSYEELESVIVETMKFLLEAGVPWREDSWFRYHLLLTLDFLQGIHRRPHLVDPL